MEIMRKYHQNFSEDTRFKMNREIMRLILTKRSNMKNVCAEMLIRMSVVGRCDMARNLLRTSSKIGGRKNND